MAELTPGSTFVLDAAEEGCIEVPSDIVCTPLARYDDLIRAETERDILFRAYQNIPDYGFSHILDAIFDPRFKYQGITKDTK